MKKKEIAKEYPESREEFFANDIINVLKKSLQSENGRNKFHRRFHAKSLGLLEAEFMVATDLPEDFKIGLFTTDKKYKAWVRFSNAATRIGSDGNKGVRGMSIKVLDVDKKPAENDALGNTQDFLLTNNRILFPGTVKTQSFGIRILFISPIYILHLLGYIILKLRSAISFWRGQIRLTNVLECTYFSATPYLFGEKQAVKWQAVSLKPATSKMPVKKNFDFLRQQLSDDLSKGEFTFELKIQLQQDPEKQPIEESSVKWQTDFTRVATIKILNQDFNTVERKKLEDTIVFTPWHSMPDHRPLGSINRMRRKIYSQLFQFRMEHNKAIAIDKES